MRSARSSSGENGKESHERQEEEEEVPHCSLRRWIDETSWQVVRLDWPACSGIQELDSAKQYRMIAIAQLRGSAMMPLALFSGSTFALDHAVFLSCFPFCRDLIVR